MEMDDNKRRQAQNMNACFLMKKMGIILQE